MRGEHTVGNRQNKLAYGRKKRYTVPSEKIHNAYSGHTGITGGLAG